MAPNWTKWPRKKRLGVQLSPKKFKVLKSRKKKDFLPCPNLVM